VAKVTGKAGCPAIEMLGGFRTKELLVMALGANLDRSVLKKEGLGGFMRSVAPAARGEGNRAMHAGAFGGDFVVAAGAELVGLLEVHDVAGCGVVAGAAAAFNEGLMAGDDGGRDDEFGGVGVDSGVSRDGGIGIGNAVEEKR
jgi:hypothetical protein